jgi:hypothetical protein
MPFVPPPGRAGRERILLYGGHGVGKSLSWIDVAMEMRKRGNEGKLYVLDTDAAVEDLFDELWPEGRDMIENWVVSDFEELSEATVELLSHKPDSENGDFVVIDLISSVWEWVQEFYAEKVYGMTIEDYITETSTLIHAAKEAGEKGHEREFGDWKPGDWMHMKKIYLGWERKLVLGGRGHVIACAEESEMNAFVTKDRDIKAYSGTGGGIGFRPRGQNSLGHRFRTVIRVQKTGVDQKGTANRNLIMAKDRYREHRWNELNEARAGNPALELGDSLGSPRRGFSHAYLKKIAKWRTA